MTRVRYTAQYCLIGMKPEIWMDEITWEQDTFIGRDDAETKAYEKIEPPSHYGQYKVYSIRVEKITVAHVLTFDYNA